MYQYIPPNGLALGATVAVLAAVLAAGPPKLKTPLGAGGLWAEAAKLKPEFAAAGCCCPAAPAAAPPPPPKENTPAAGC